MNGSQRLHGKVFFKGLQYDLETGTLCLDGGEEQILTGQLRAALDILLQRYPLGVSRDDLRTALWPAETLEQKKKSKDDDLNNAMYRLHERLGDRAADPTYFQKFSNETGNGYVWILKPLAMTVEEAAGSSRLRRPPRNRIRGSGAANLLHWKSQGTWIAMGAVAVLVLTSVLWMRPRQAKPSQQAEGIRIAVLLFKDLSGGPRNRYADAITEDIITDLGRTRQLRPISFTSIMALGNSQKTIPQIARELHVPFLLEGSIQFLGGQIKVSARLVDEQDNLHWEHTSYPQLEDVRSNHDDVAWTIAVNIFTRLVSDTPPLIAHARQINPAANDDYWDGVLHWMNRTPEDLRKAVFSFQAAVREAPDDPRAYVGLADANNILSLWEDDLSSPSARFTQARYFADQALKLDDGMAEAHTSKAFELYRFNDGVHWDLAGADREFRRAIELNPSYATAHQWYGEFLSDMGHHDQALLELRQARDLNPLAPQVLADTAAALNYARRSPEAENVLRELFQLKPNFLPGHLYLGSTYLFEKRYDEALKEYRTAQQIAPDSIDSYHSEAMVYACQGDRRAVWQIRGRRLTLKRFMFEIEHQRRPPAFEIARLHACLGDKAEAVRWLKKAYDDHVWEMVLLKVEPFFDSLRDDADFKRLMRDVGLAAN